jgi:hypothetical protein
MSSPDDVEPVGTSKIAADGVDVRKALDEISLEQALLDVDIANARVADLTSRLVSARLEVSEARTGELRQRVADLEAQLAAIHASRSYALSRMIARVRSLFR